MKQVKCHYYYFRIFSALQFLSNSFGAGDKKQREHRTEFVNKLNFCLFSLKSLNENIWKHTFR